MSQLHQMQCSFVPEEDRIMFRMNTRNRQEFRFWMTRRYVDLLWTTISNVVEQKEAPQARDELKKSATIQDKHEKTVEKSDFKTQYQESTYLPMGKEPLLLFSVGVKKSPEGKAILCMHPKSGEGIELAMNDQIVHSLCKLLIDSSEKAKWGLNLNWTKSHNTQVPKQGLN
ncbi:MAG: hypothetical protein AAF226_06220 [Verrucomicrobiota bacterium]